MVIDWKLGYYFFAQFLDAVQPVHRPMSTQGSNKPYFIIGDTGCRTLYIPLVAHTNLGNEQSMVRWVKKADGYRPCPICGRAVAVPQKLANSPPGGASCTYGGRGGDLFPFCSERCRLVDLGRWLDGHYRIPGEPLADGGRRPGEEGEAR